MWLRSRRRAPATTARACRGPCRPPSAGWRRRSARRCAATAGRDQRVVASVDHERRDVERGSSSARRRWRRWRRAAVTRPPDRTAVVRRRRVLDGRARVAVLLRMPDHPRRPTLDVRLARAAAAPAAAARLGRRLPDPGSPVMLMTEIRLRTRSGCSMAMVWTIMPPIDAPRTCARSMPRASSRPDRVGRHVAERVRHRGTG